MLQFVDDNEDEEGRSMNKDSFTTRDETDKNSPQMHELPDNILIQTAEDFLQELRETENDYDHCISLPTALMTEEADMQVIDEDPPFDDCISKSSDVSTKSTRN